MTLLAAFMLMCFAGLQLTVTQNVTDCTDINAGLVTTPTDPVTVPDLPVCVDQRGGPQCCTTQYIMQQITLIEQQFLQGLRIELRERFQGFETIVDSLRMFIEGDFINGYLKSIGSLDLAGGLNGLVNGFISELHETITDEEVASQNDTFSQILNNLVARIENAAINNLAGESNLPNASGCIRQVIERRIQLKNMNAQVTALEQIRRVMVSIDDLRDFIRNFIVTLGGFQPLQQCVNTVVQRNICGRCEAVRPPFCENVCAAIVSACYSPFNDALSRQLNQLWDTVRQLLDVAATSIADLNANKGLLNTTIIIDQIKAVCQIDIKLPRHRRQEDALEDLNIPVLPNLISMAAESLMGGPFDYPGRTAEAPGICRLVNTSNSNCWDGMQVRAEDIDQFDGMTIKDQESNNVIKISQQELMDQAASLGTPVTDLLTSSAFVQVAPAGFVFPEIGGTPGSNGAAVTYFSITLMILMLLATIFL